ncbi:MAG: exodeoxyribonuclease Xth [Deltaproteobacteria bacterium]|nr:exodeoxyribonuclease Xth [Deltaproteobacteria bacterium]
MNASPLYSGSMKIVTWNVNGIRARQAQVTELIGQEQPDILCLQELKAKPEQVPEALRARADYWCYWHGAAAYSGVSIHLRKERFPDKPVFTHPPFDHESRIVEVGLAALVVASVYVPNGGKDYAAKLAFLEAMERYARTMHAAGRALIVCGDLNVTRTDRDVHPKERKPNAIGQRPDERALLARLLGCGLIDVGRALDPDNDNLFTWWAPWRSLRQRNIGWRLDYVLASESWARRALSCPVLREFGTSDHGPVVATFAAS